MDEVKVCPECEEEYTLTATGCVECGVALVLPSELAPAPEPEDFPDVDSLACVRVGPLPWTRALSEALATVGIEHRVERDTRAEAEGGVASERFGGETVYGTWVLPADREAAEQVDRVLFAAFEPESAEAAEGEDACPACSEPLDASALACSGCGLEFG